MVRGVTVNRPEADAGAAACPMHKVVLVRNFTEEGRLSPPTAEGTYAPMRCTSMEDFLARAELQHKFEAEVDGVPFVSTLEIKKMSDLHPDEIEKGKADGPRNDFSRFKRRRDAVSRVKLALEKMPLLGAFIDKQEKREGAAEALRNLADFLDSMSDDQG